MSLEYANWFMTGTSGRVGNIHDIGGSLNTKS
jgi:hypothetical protein